MIPMMVDLLAATGTSESREQLREIVEDFVARLTGKQTIYQMMRLAEEISARGGVPLEPLQYKHLYHERLWEQVKWRVAAIRDGSVAADALTVPGSRELLRVLQRHAVLMYLASGTDLKYVQDEAALLQLDPFFGPHIYAALDDYKKFSKAMIVAQVLRDTGLPGERILGVGDGYVEIEEIKKVGGFALGVASNEDTREGINEWKRRRLIEAGADAIVADYRDLPALLQLLGFPADR
jgi:beta-phosphoglucomutase-like phosphatase (HAD superfamily)